MNCLRTNIKRKEQMCFNVTQPLASLWPEQQLLNLSFFCSRLWVEMTKLWCSPSQSLSLYPPSTTWRLYQIDGWDQRLSVPSRSSISSCQKDILHIQVGWRWRLHSGRGHGWSGGSFGEQIFALPRSVPGFISLKMLDQKKRCKLIKDERKGKG